LLKESRVLLWIFRIDQYQLGKAAKSSKRVTTSECWVQIAASPPSMFPETGPSDTHSKGKRNRSTQVHYRALPAELQRRASPAPTTRKRFRRIQQRPALTTAAACALRTRCPNFESKEFATGSARVHKLAYSQMGIEDNKPLIISA
jgi:hypothetical protein